MATPNNPEMIKITLNTLGLQDIDPNTNQPLGTFRGALKNLDNDLRAFERVLQSATNGFELFNNSLKKIDPKTGLAEQSFFVRKEEFDNAMAALKAKSAELSTRRGGDYGIDVSSVENFNTSFRVYGKRAQRKAMEGIDRLGGVAVVNASDSDKLDVSVPLDAASAAGMTQRQKRALVERAIPEAAKLSQIEKNKRDKEREEREAKENEREREKEGAESAKKAMVVRKALLAVVTIIADLTRRLLTASLRQAAQNDRMAVEAHSVGMTALGRRGLDIFDIAHGMEKGTTFGAIQSVQGMFGDITRLDENALKTLARVMGGEISTLVMSGQGGKNPDQLLDKILDKYFKQYLSGKNSLGQSVGMEQARRELVTSLQSVSPEIAKLFARMVDDYASGVYGRFGNSAEWRNTTPTNRAGLTEADQKFSTEIGKKYNSILAIVEDLKTSFFTRLSGSMDELLTKIKNLRVGQSEESKIEEDTRNRQKNEESKRVMEQQNLLYNLSAQKAIDRLSSTSATPISVSALGMRNYTEEQAGRFGYTVEELAGIQLGIYDKDYFKGKYGADAAAYVARGKDIARNVMMSPEAQDELARAMVNLEQIRKINEANKNAIGSGKIADYSMTEAKQTLYAQRLAEENARAIAGRGAYSELGSEERAVVIGAYADFLAANPSIFSGKTNAMSDDLRRRFTENAKRMAKQKGIRNLKDLSREDAVLAFAEADAASWYALNFIPQVYNISDKNRPETTFLMNRAGIATRKNINEADSKILSMLAFQEATFAPNSRYSLSGKQGQSGEYLLTIQMVDDKGKKVGAARTFTFADTKGVVGNLGTMRTDFTGRATSFDSEWQNDKNNAN